MERSGIQDAPDFAALHPGYNGLDIFLGVPGVLAVHRLFRVKPDQYFGQF
jgi:hypothetical protein